MVHGIKQKDLVLPMYMGVILVCLSVVDIVNSAPHVYGGDPNGRLMMFTL